jgi:hypothetical protein
LINQPLINKKMTLEKTHELIAIPANPGSVNSGCGYNRNTCRMVSAQVMRKLGQQTVDVLIREHGLEKQWQLKPGTKFESAFKS